MGLKRGVSLYLHSRKTCSKGMILVTTINRNIKLMEEEG